MAIERLKIKRNWLENTNTREENWDEIANNLVAWSLRVDNNAKQVGLDIDGDKYNFNNVGRATQTTSIVDRLTTLEATQDIVGTRNIGLDLSTQSTITLDGSDGTNLSATNSGLVTFNSTNDAGQLVTREVTSNLTVTLTAAHWGFTGDGDLTDYVLWVILIDTGSASVLGVLAQGGRETVTAADSETAVGNVNSIEKVLTSAAISSTNNITYLGWVKADFDDTGNAGGENFWTVQNSVGDINIGSVPTRVEGDISY